MIKSLPLASSVILVALASAAPVAAQEIPSLKGTWTGQRERIAFTEGYRDGSATLVIAEQRGMTFKGTMAWSTPSGEVREDLVGGVTPGGRLMAGADAQHRQGHRREVAERHAGRDREGEGTLG